MGRTVNPLSYDFEGSNPSLPTKKDCSNEQSFFFLWETGCLFPLYLEACILHGLYHLLLIDFIAFYG